MKNKTFGISNTKYVRGDSAYIWASKSSAFGNYLEGRQNGTYRDQPNRSMPKDGTYTWETPNEASPKIRYTEGPGDRAWMEECDRNYLARLERERRLYEEEPEEWAKRELEKERQRPEEERKARERKEKEIEAERLREQREREEIQRLREQELARRRAKANGKKMEKQTFGLSSSSITLTPSQLRAGYRTVSRGYGSCPHLEEAFEDYYFFRTLGACATDQDRSIPKDGTYTWETPNEASSKIRYTEGPGDRAWMEERERRLREEEPEVWEQLYGAQGREHVEIEAPSKITTKLESVHTLEGNLMASEEKKSMDDDDKPSISSLSLSDWQIPWSELRLNAEDPSSKLGEGGFGVVYKACYTQVRDFVAIKVVHPFRANPDAMKELQQEAEMMSRLRSDFIVRFYGISEKPDRSQLLVMEYATLGSLYDYLHPEEKEEKTSPPTLLWSQRYELASDMAKGLQYLHQHNPMIIHRDLKSLNVLLTKSFLGQLQAKLTDFGLAKIKSVTSSSARTQSAVGTPLWMAPELLIADEEGNVANANSRTDVYALGIIFWELTTSEMPFANRNMRQLIALLIQARRPAMKESCPPRFSQLIQRCWNQTPTQRPSASDVVNEIRAAANAHDLKFGR